MSNIKVFCRIRPLNQRETSLINYTIKEQTLQLGEQKFTFDKVLDIQASQSDVYEDIGKPIIDQVLQGFNATLLMYGQTSSGKTYTMIGDTQQPGIIRRTINDLFDAIDSSPSESEFRIKISIYEIYKERVKDLLDLNKSDLKVREMANQFYVQSVTQQWVSDKDEIFNALQKSLLNRQVGQTNLNEVSSRSHLILQLTIIMNNEIEGTSYTGQLIMADLAGSENASKAGTTGNSLQEGAFINKSLLTLSNVINGLSEKAQHVPFRESNLTKLLWNGLSKNSMTSLIITCSPCISNESETISTLRFGVRAKMIKTQPKVNKEVTIKELEIQNTKLIRELEEKNFIIDELKKDDKKVKIIQLEEQIIELKKEINQVKELNSQLLNDLDMRLLDNSELQTNFKNSLLEAEQLKSQNLQLQQQIQETTALKEQEIYDLQQNIENLIQNNKQKDEKIAELMKHIQKSSFQIQENRIENIQTDTVTDLIKQVDELKTKLHQEKTTIKQQNKVYESQVHILTKQIQSQEKEIGTLNETVRGYQLQVMKNNDELLNLTNKNSRLQKDLENRIQKVTELSERYDFQQDQLNKLKRQLDYEEVGVYEENQKLHNQLQEVSKKLFQEESLRRSQQMLQSSTLQAKISRIQQLEEDNYHLRLDIQTSSIMQSQKESIIMSQYQSNRPISKVVKKQSQNLVDLL